MPSSPQINRSIFPSNPIPIKKSPKSRPPNPASEAAGYSARQPVPPGHAARIMAAAAAAIPNANIPTRFLVSPSSSWSVSSAASDE